MLHEWCFVFRGLWVSLTGHIGLELLCHTQGEQDFLVFCFLASIVFSTVSLLNLTLNKIIVALAKQQVFRYQVL